MQVHSKMVNTNLLVLFLMLNMLHNNKQQENIQHHFGCLHQRIHENLALLQHPNISMYYIFRQPIYNYFLYLHLQQFHSYPCTSLDTHLFPYQDVRNPCNSKKRISLFLLG